MDSKVPATAAAARSGSARRMRRRSATALVLASALTLFACLGSDPAPPQQPLHGDNSRALWWPAIQGAAVVQEWYSDIPWHQKLGTYAGNEIDEALVLPYGALSSDAQAYCAANSLLPPACMIELGVVNVIGMLRTDTPYSAQDAKIKAANECQDPTLPCIEVKLAISSFWAQRAASGVVTMQPRPLGKEPAVSDGLVPPLNSLYNGYVITDGSTYGPQMPWYMAHYCDSMFPGSDVQDPVCYGDYFSPMNSGFNALPGAPGGSQGWPRTVPWSVYPSAPPPAPDNHCAAGLTQCTMVLAGFPLGALPSDPTQLQSGKYNNFLLNWFNNALGNFPNDAGPLELQHHFPWNGQPVAWATFLYPQGAQNPFLGQYPTTPAETSTPPSCTVNAGGTGNPLCTNTGNVMSSLYLYPRQCTLSDLASGNVARLRQCGLNYELHHNGYLSQWPTDHWQELRDAGMLANQYGRTSFLFAGVPGMQMPVSFYTDPASVSGLSIYEQAHNASIFSLYLPIANVADVKRAFPGRNYSDTEFFHTLLMSNHMEAEPALFAEGIRGRALWHNEYRTQKMYEQFVNNNTDKFPTMQFAASFGATSAPAPFHNNTCDGCHVRNGSGVPINTQGMLDPALQQFMAGNAYNPTQVKDYTFTGQIRPMKLVFFDLKRNATRLDGSRYSEPLSFAPNLLKSPPRGTDPAALYYTNAVMNFYGDSFHVTAPGYGYSWNYVPVNPNRLVVNAARVNAELGKTYAPTQPQLQGFQTPATCALAPAPSPTVPWPKTCADVSPTALAAAIAGGEVGFMHLNGKRLGNLSAIEAIPNQAIIGFRASQVAALGAGIAGEIIWNAGARDGVGGKQQLNCVSNSLADCFIGRFGWLGDRTSLEDQVANAAFVEMNMLSTQGYQAFYGTASVPFPIRYAYPNCGPANQACLSSTGNANLTEADIGRMANYARWLGNPTRSEFQVALPDVVAGEAIFRQLKCNTCHVIAKIDIVPEDTMLSQPYRDRLATRVTQSAGPFLSYLGTDLLMHDMGYLSQVAGATQPIRDPSGVVLPAFQNFIQKIRTPPLKGLRFNRYVTESYKNTKAAGDPACDFLLHDGRACDAIEAAFLHDGPAVGKLGVIQGLNGLTATQLLQLRAFLYSL